MRKSNFGNIEKLNTVAITFASCKLVKEEWEEREPSDVGFDFWDDWDLITGLYINITKVLDKIAKYMVANSLTTEE